MAKDSVMNSRIIEADTNLSGNWVEFNVQCPVCKNDEYVYIYEDNQTLYCLNCVTEFNKADVDIKDELLKGTIKKIVNGEKLENKEKKTVDGSTDKTEDKKVETTVYTPKCGRHKPTMIIDGKNWSVWGGTKDRCVPFVNDFDIVLNLSGNSIKFKHEIPIAGFEQFTSGGKFIEVMLDWPDFSIPDLVREFWVKLLDHVKKNKLKLLVVCVGGHGRTGTALAAMMTLALEWKSERAINWIRDNYCEHAIESFTQEDYIKYVAGEGKQPEAGSYDKGWWTSKASGPSTGFTGSLWEGGALDI